MKCNGFQLYQKQIIFLAHIMQNISFDLRAACKIHSIHFIFLKKEKKFGTK